MTRSARSLLARSFTLALAVGGCNTLLDNQPGRLEDASARQDTRDAGAGGASPPASDDPSPAPGCDRGQACDGVCVDPHDPAYGCGSADCHPCSAPHGTATCRGDACALEACDDGYADCNGDPADGCEVDLSKATSCGGCKVVCPAKSPICAPSGAGFECTNGCAPPAPLLCGAECVSPLTSVNHCGRCNAKCADVENGTAACEDGKCTFTCKPSYHACAGKCVVATDPKTCGPACTPCPVPANAVATCQADACGMQCKAGFDDCNENPEDGCEAKLATDPLHCGACGTACESGRCKNGVCEPAADAGP